MLEGDRKILWISTIDQNDCSRSSWFANKIVPRLAKSIDVHIFTTERNDRLSQNYFHQENIRIDHILKLPIELKNNSQVTLIYNFEDTNLYNLSKRFLVNYPGLGIFHDLSFLNSECNNFSHGTTPIELNSWLSCWYGKNSIRIGDQLVLKKSTDIYRTLYDFIITFNKLLIGSFVFGESAFKFLSRYQANICTLSMFFEDKNFINFNTKPSDLSEFRIIVVVKDILSQAAIDFKNCLSEFNLKNIKDNQVYTLLIKNSEVIEINPICNMNDYELYFQENNISMLLELSGTYLSGLSPWSYSALENGIPTYMEKGIESLEIKHPCKFLYTKEEKFFDLVDKIYSNADANFKRTEIDYDYMSGQIIDFVNLNYKINSDYNYKNIEKKKMLITNIFEENLKELSKNLNNFSEKEKNDYLNNFRIAMTEVFSG